MKFALALSMAFFATGFATGASAAPLNDAKAAIKAACAVIHVRLPNENNSCTNLVAQLHGGVWTVTEKDPASDIMGGGEPAVELSQSDGELLNFLLSN